ncbi:TIGR03086 family protein [Blastococcus aurantiacus]|uniref:TIGR03086 family protein n=1 Tax=Blastococcus aurantiacus TaxID=1550231 RepID=A0A1G7I5K2_9ACTN|nr:maleylpyruvate isomerase family mycothiol-dependent enzyme [Blastococcus aurantiacus]SDF08000.1 TIGR03086 family protein [Blastococcus aurantiacus]
MNATATAYEAAATPLTAVLDTLPPGAWSAPSPCEGWTAADVVAHLVETQRDFLGQRGVDLGAAPDVAAEPAAAWRDHAKRVQEALADDVVATPYESFFGPSTVGGTFDQFYVWDMVVHRWDVASAAGLPSTLTDEELDRIERGIEGFGQALYMEGICRDGVEPPADADRATRLLARLGRRP